MFTLPPPISARELSLVHLKGEWEFDRLGFRAASCFLHPAFSKPRAWFGGVALSANKYGTLISCLAFPLLKLTVVSQLSLSV